jgi:hypothetical protein
MIGVHVILRICLRDRKSSSIQEDERWRRVHTGSHEEMVLICLKSLVRSVNSCRVPVRMTVIDDHSGDNIGKIRGVMKGCKKEWKISKLRGTGINDSMYEQLKVGMKVGMDELLYIVEDDYLHDEHAIEKMCMAHKYFSERFKDDVVLHPFSCPFDFMHGREEPTVVFSLSSRYWRHVKGTAFTFMTTKKVIKENWDAWSRMALNFPSEVEQDTIHKICKELVPKHGQTVICFSPMPSLAYHLSYVEPVRLNCSHSCWEDLWAEVGTADLGDGKL